LIARVATAIAENEAIDPVIHNAAASGRSARGRGRGGGAASEGIPDVSTRLPGMSSPHGLADRQPDRSNAMARLVRKGNERVGFVELFFDLVFVFAVTQLSHGLLHHHTLHGALEIGLLFLLMTAGLFLSMAVPEAFAERGLAFALAHVAMQLGRPLFVLWTVWDHRSLGGLIEVEPRA
jgi:hypothetical protein